MDVTELIKCCIDKDKKAWDLFVKRYAKLIYWAIRKRFSLSSFDFDEDDVHNVFQEVFMSILEGQKLKQVKDSKLISGWLAMVASNKTVDFMRQKMRYSQHFNLEDFALKDEISEEDLFHRDIKNIVSNIISALRDKDKIVISLNLLEGKTHKEIAHMLAISINTVSTIIARTKEKLKTELEKRGITGSLLT